MSTCAWSHIGTEAMNAFFAALSEHRFLQSALAAAWFSSIGCGVVGSNVVVERIAFLAGTDAHSILGGMHHRALVSARSAMGGKSLE